MDQVGVADEIVKPGTALAQRPAPARSMTEGEPC